MKPKTKSDPNIAPKSVTMGDAPAPATATESPKTGWAIIARVHLSNGQNMALVHKTETQPDAEAVNAFHRRAIGEMRSQLAEGVSFDNSAVVVSTIEDK